ncbi:MAG: twitch domain-containing radical SAM protein [Bdellovibrionota bacterium]
MTIKILPCAKRWNFPSVDLSTRMVRTCVRAYGPSVSREDVKKLGKNIFLNHPYMQKGRELMLKGEYQDDCKGCYKFLENGDDGFRTPYATTLSELSKSYGETVQSFEDHITRPDYEEKYLISPQARELEVSFGNICDLMCVYCDSNYSSLIEAEDRKYNQTNLQFARNPIEANDDFLNAFWKWMEEDSIKDIHIIHLIGGETLYNNYFYVFMKRLNEIYVRGGYSHEITLNVFTNLNNKSSVNKFIETVQSIHPNFRFNLMFSNESVGAKAEFIRSGLSWERAQANVKAVASVERIKLGFSPSFNALSMTSATDFLMFIRSLKKNSSHQFLCGNNYISTPQGYSPFILSTDFIPYIGETLYFLSKFGNQFLTNESVEKLSILFESLRGGIQNNSENPTPQLNRDRVDFFRRVNLMKTRRNADFDSAFPEYRDFYDYCGTLATENA